MKKLIRNIAIFIFPILLCLLVMEFFLRKIPNDYMYKAEYLEKNSSDVEVLYLGNSHTYFGINPEYSSFKSFNAAYTSQSLDLDYKVFSKYKNWESLKTIVIPVDYISLYTQLGQRVESLS